MSNTYTISVQERRENLECSWPLHLPPGTGLSSVGGDGFRKTTVAIGTVQREMLARSLVAKGKRPMLRESKKKRKTAK